MSIFNSLFTKETYMGIYKTVPVYQNTRLLKQHGITFSGVMIGKEGFKIITDRIFPELSLQTQEYLMEHEIAHIELDHLKSIPNVSERIRYVNDGIVHPHEIEADMKVVSDIGLKSYVLSLNELMSYFPKDDIGRKEFELRKKCLLEKIGN